MIEIECLRFAPHKNSVEKEFEFLFKIEWNENHHVVDIDNVYIEVNGKKIGNLTEFNRLNSTAIYHSAIIEQNDERQHYYYNATMKISEAVVNFLESERQKTESKGLIFNISFNVTDTLMNIRLANMYLAGSPAKYSIGKQYIYKKEDFDTKKVVLSGNDSAYLFIKRYDRTVTKEYKIDMMRWVQEFVPYLTSHKILVYEFIEPKNALGEGKLADRFERSNASLLEMEKHMAHGEWKQVIITSRPILELFKNFSEFETLLIDTGYSKTAFTDLNASILGMFNFISKFHHGLGLDREEINQQMAVHKEDAQLIYSFCTALLHLISKKSSRRV